MCVVVLVAGLRCQVLRGSGGFFFLKQKTADEMRISDWSSDVCSSDLDSAVAPDHQIVQFETRRFDIVEEGGDCGRIDTGRRRRAAGEAVEIGRASCRERVCQYV